MISLTLGIMLNLKWHKNKVISQTICLEHAVLIYGWSHFIVLLILLLEARILLFLLFCSQVYSQVLELSPAHSRQSINTYWINQGKSGKFCEEFLRRKLYETQGAVEWGTMTVRSGEQSLSLDENILPNNPIFYRQVAHINVDWRRYTNCL